MMYITYRKHLSLRGIAVAKRAFRPTKSGPYVGVTGFMHSDEVAALLATVPAHSRYRLMVGVLMSSKTLRGDANSWPGRYPKAETVASLFPDDERALNLVHYSTDERLTLHTQLEQVAWLGGMHCDGIQLNMAWPNFNDIVNFRLAHPDLYIVLQIGKRAMERVESLPRFAEQINFYAEAVDAILIDPSGGRGVPLDVAPTSQFLCAVRHAHREIGIGIAGGLGPHSLHLLQPFALMFDDLSCDAEGRLRKSEEGDSLDLSAATAYAEAAFAMLNAK
jgi:hypothetical protein